MAKQQLNKSIIGLILFSSVMLSATANTEKDTLVFGIVPQQSGSKLSAKWTPILKYLEEQTGMKIRFATARNIPTFEKRLLAGKYDVAYMNPYHYTQYHEAAGYTAFAKAKNKRLKGILVVAKDSPYKSINDLEGEQLAFPSQAFAASLVMRAKFNEDGVSIDANNVASHDSVYRNVARGRYAAGGGVMRTFKNTSAEHRDKLRVLWTSDGYTPHAFAAHPRVPANVVSTLQQTLLSMDQNAYGKKLLKSIRLKGIETASNLEWDDVRALELN
jgi:phosphonate transport system substrate-binding protein